MKIGEDIKHIDRREILPNPPLQREGVKKLIASFSPLVGVRERGAVSAGSIGGKRLC